MAKTMTQRVDEETHILRDQIGFKTSKVSRIMQQRLEHALAAHGMSRHTWCVLTSIGMEGISTPSGVAQNMGVARPLVSRLVKTMAQDGLIQVVVAANDGRNRRLTLTPLGQEKLDECLPIVRENNAYFETKMTPEQLAHFYDALDNILASEQVQLDRL